MLSLIYYPKSQHKTWLFVSNIGLPSIKGEENLSSFARQSRSAPRKVKDRKIDSESRLEQFDNISPLASLIEFCHKLNVTVVSKNDSIILTELAEIPPRMLFSLEIFEDYTISCFKGSTNISYNDLINSLTHKIEKFSQTELILGRLKEAKHKHRLPEELSQTASYIKSILDSESPENSEINKVEVLIDQLHLLSKQNHGESYDTAMMKTAI